MREMLVELASRYEKATEFSEASTEQVLRDFAAEKNVKAGALINGARVALTGQGVAPSLFAVMANLGQERTVARAEARKRHTCWRRGIKHKPHHRHLANRFVTNKTLPPTCSTASAVIYLYSFFGEPIGNATMPDMRFGDRRRFPFLRAVWKPAEENLLSTFRRRRSDDRRHSGL